MIIVKRYTLLILFLSIFSMNLSAKLFLSYYKSTPIEYIRSGMDLNYEYKLSVEIRKGLMAIYGKNWITEAPANKNVPRSICLYFGHKDIFAAEIMTKLKIEGAYFNYFQDIKNILDSLSKINYTIYGQLSCPNYSGPFLVKNSLKGEAQILLKYSYEYFIDYFEKFNYLGAILPKDMSIGDIPNELFYVYLGIRPDFFSPEINELYLRQCNSKGLRAIDWWLVNEDYTSEEKELFIEYIEKENDYILGLPDPEDCYVLPFGYSPIPPEECASIFMSNGGKIANF